MPKILRLTSWLEHRSTTTQPNKRKTARCRRLLTAHLPPWTKCFFHRSAEPKSPAALRYLMRHALKYQAQDQRRPFPRVAHRTRSYAKQHLSHQPSSAADCSTIVMVCQDFAGPPALRPAFSQIAECPALPLVASGIFASCRMRSLPYP
jgi:hypothetical protein